MNTIRKQWVDALRSGNFKQGRYVLRSIDERFCCLGVLAELCKVKWENSGMSDNYCYLADKHGYISTIDEKMYTAAGLIGDQVAHLIFMNDTEVSFSEIADYIEGLPDEPGN